MRKNILLLLSIFLIFGCEKFDLIEEQSPAENIYHPNSGVELFEMLDYYSFTQGANIYRVYLNWSINEDLIPEEYDLILVQIFRDGEFYAEQSAIDTDFFDGNVNLGQTYSYQLRFTYNPEGVTKLSDEYWVEVE